MLKFLGKTARAISLDLGMKTPQVFYDIKAGKCGISKELANRIQEKFGNISASWLLTGDGDMIVNGDGNRFVGVHQHNKNGDNYQGDGLTVNKGDADYIAMIKKRDEQIDRLLAIIEKMQA